MQKTPPALRGLKLIELMQWGQRFAGWELSELTGIKPRTLRNYFTQLKAAGYCIESTPGADGEYWLDPGHYVYPLRFTNEEARTIVIALDVLRTVAPPDSPLMQDAKVLHYLIGRLLPGAALDEVRQMGKEVTRGLTKMRAVYAVWEETEGRR